MCINRTIKEYAIPIYEDSFLSDINNYKKFVINDGLFYETLLMLIRGETVKFSKRIAKFNRVKEKELRIKVDEAHAKYSQTKTDQDASHLRSYKEDLERNRKSYIDGLIVRSRTRWHEEGEKSSK